MAQEEEDVRDYSLMEDQKAIRQVPSGQSKHECLDHTAAVQLHAWGSALEKVFEQCAMATVT